MDISIGIVAFNEEKNLSGVFEDILKQSYPHKRIELVLVDSMSEDGTRDLMQKFAAEYAEEFLAIQIMENPGRILSCGWNRAVDAFTTDALVRIDAHSSIPADFVEKNVAALEEGESVVGGARPNIVEEDSPWQDVLLAAESSMFGSSAATFRRGGGKAYVKSLFHGAYRREVFEKAGRFREDLGRTEDNEFNYRVRQHGFRLCLVPEIISYQMIRPSLTKMCRQKFGNGYWVGLTAGVCPGCLSLYHFVPFAFVIGILVTTLLAIFSHPFLAILMWGMYWLLAVIMAVKETTVAVQAAAESPIAAKTSAARETESAEPAMLYGRRANAGYVLLPVLFFLLHVSYGAGTFIGVVKMPFWRRKHHGGEGIYQRGTEGTAADKS